MIVVRMVGYPGDVEKLPPKLHDRELAPRRRKPIEEIAFAGRWDRPFTQEEAPATAAGPPIG